MDAKNESRNKNILIGALIAVVLIMGVGYAAFAQQLTINGNAEITSKWDVHIDGITAGEPVGTATTKEAPTFTNTTATFSTNLVAPGDSLTYTVSIKNGGTLDAKVTDSGVTFTEGANTGAIKYTYTGIAAGDVIAAGASKTFTVTVTYLSSVETQPTQADLSNSVTMILNFEQSK